MVILDFVKNIEEENSRGIMLTMPNDRSTYIDFTTEITSKKVIMTKRINHKIYIVVTCT